ncbi:MAG: tRNA (adenosine(37)-N6)-threonylcarbamoyltransferase complex ATPase subunit type 1 TsaE [Vulcanimicrobiota bacterium]
MCNGVVYCSSSAEDTRCIGATLARSFTGGDIILLYGELGAGKTTLIQGICKALGVRERVTSSSFVLLRLLNGIMPVYHFDLYRLSTVEELDSIGYEEFLFSNGVSLIEWPEKIIDFAGDEWLSISLKYADDDPDKRQITFLPRGERFVHIIEELRTATRGTVPGCSTGIGIKLDEHL